MYHTSLKKYLFDIVSLVSRLNRLIYSVLHRRAARCNYNMTSITILQYDVSKDVRLSLSYSLLHLAFATPWNSKHHYQVSACEILNRTGSTLKSQSGIFYKNSQKLQKFNFADKKGKMFRVMYYLGTHRI